MGPWYDIQHLDRPARHPGVVPATDWNAHARFLPVRRRDPASPAIVLVLLGMLAAGALIGADRAPPAEPVEEPRAATRAE